MLEDRIVPSASAEGTAFAALRGQAFAGIVGTFTPESGMTTADYTATILWGDGTQSSGTIDGSGDVSGSHTYNAPGAFAVAFQVENIYDDSTNVGVALGLVESLTQDTQLQIATGVTLTQSATTAQTGTDSGGLFDLTETGTLDYTPTKTVYQPGASITSQATHTLSFSLQGSAGEKRYASTLDFRYFLMIAWACGPMAMVR
jgi:hypothetical protein